MRHTSGTALISSCLLPRRSVMNHKEPGLSVRRRMHRTRSHLASRERCQHARFHFFGDFPDVIDLAALGRGCAKTKTDLVAMSSGGRIFAFFCSERDHKPQNSRCGYTARSFHTAWVVIGRSGSSDNGDLFNLYKALGVPGEGLYPRFPLDGRLQPRLYGRRPIGQNRTSTAAAILASTNRWPPPTCSHRRRTPPPVTKSGTFLSIPCLHDDANAWRLIWASVVVCCSGYWAFRFPSSSSWRSSGTTK